MTVSPEFVARAIEFYARQKEIPVALSDIWKINSNTYCADFIRALDSGDAAFISDFLQQHISGIVNEPDTFSRQAISAGTALGDILRLNPFQPFDACGVTPRELVELIECRLGMPLFTPYFSTGELLNAICGVVNLIRSQSWPADSMVEIGPGHGAVGYVLLKSNPDLKYHTIDLPFMSVVHAYRLSCVFDTVCFEGEPTTGKQVIVHGVSKPTLTVPLIFNQDSLPEFEISEQHLMLQFIERTLEPGGIFYSVNQESSRGGQRRVFDAAMQCPRLKLSRRSPAWDKEPAYVEEVFVKT